MGNSHTKQSTPTVHQPPKAQPLQAKQIQLALKFLESPEVAAISHETKATFLRNNGIPSDLIDKAFLEYQQRKKSKQGSPEQPSSHANASAPETSMPPKRTPPKSDPT